MNTKPRAVERDKREHIVSVRFSNNEVDRLRKLTDSLALPVEVENSKLVRTLSLMALEALERKQSKKGEK